MKLTGKIAIVTGGSRGIGFAIAKILSENGALVVITSKDSEKIKKAEAQITNSFGITCDIKKKSEVQNVLNKTIEKFGKLDILVNNAGIFPKIKQLHEIDEEEWNEVLDVNLTGQFRFTKEARPHLQKTSGCIINISSDAGLKAYQGFNADAYSAAKAALIFLTNCWALEYAKYNIRVNTVCPTFVVTPMTKKFLKSKKFKREVLGNIPLGKFAELSDVASAAVFLASDAASMITGTSLLVDGGWNAK